VKPGFDRKALQRKRRMVAFQRIPCSKGTVQNAIDPIRLKRYGGEDTSRPPAPNSFKREETERAEKSPGRKIRKKRAATMNSPGG